jgi:hypothetical protein
MYIKYVVKKFGYIYWEKCGCKRHCQVGQRTNCRRKQSVSWKEEVRAGERDIYIEGERKEPEIDR